MVDKIGAKVDSEELISLLKCSICCCEYTNPVLTKCGHNFCLECIEECIDRNHECPECKKKLVKEELCKNVQVGRLQRHIQDLRSKAKNELVENVLALESGFGNNRNLVLALLQDNGKDQIARFELYCENAKKEHESTKRKLKNKYSSLPPQQQANPQTQLNQAEEMREADERYKMIIDYHLKVYNDYIKQAFICPDQLSILLSVHLPKKNLILGSVYVSPSAPLREVRLIIEKLFKERDPIIKWALNLCYIITNPLTKASLMIPMLAEMKTLSELNVIHGTKIELDGDVLCESDVPKPCITLDFRAEDKKAYDYYSCETCSSNWICEPCIQQCHKGHSYKNHMKEHIPTWACCYCLKKNCQLPNKKNSMGSVIIKPESL